MAQDHDIAETAQDESTRQGQENSPSPLTSDPVLKAAFALGESLRMDKAKAPVAVAEPVAVGRCGISACGAGCLAECKACCDSRWIIPEYIVGIREKDYLPHRCPDCEFAEDKDDPQRQRKIHLAAAGFYEGRDPIGRFDNYDPSRQRVNEGQNQCRLALNSVKAWAMREGPHLVVLLGGTGVGKTHLAEAAAEYLAITRRAQVALATGEEFAYMLGRYLGSEEEKRRAFEGRLRHVDHLIFDEVGIAHGRGGEHNEYVSSLYREIIGWRFAQGLPTLVTGNLAGDENVKQILGDRVFDRLLDSESSRVISLWKAESQRKSKR